MSKEALVNCVSKFAYHTTLNSFIDSYKGNKNSGTPEEIATGVHLIISTGLDSIKNLSEKNKKWSAIKPKKELGVMFTGMIGIYNYTQDDDAGKADIGVAFPGFTWKYSITKVPHLKKTLSNTGTGGVDYRNLYLHLIDRQYKKALAVKISRGGKSGRGGYGDIGGGRVDEDARIVYEEATEHFANHVNNWTDEEKKKFMFKGLGINKHGILDSNGIIYSNTMGINFIYLWELKYKPDIYYKNVIAQAGYSSDRPKKGAAKTYVNFTLGVDDDYIQIIQLQVKFSNGLVVPKLPAHSDAWEKRKAEGVTESDFKKGYLGSFNFNAPDIRKLYNIVLVYKK
tara:strand:+ start:122 stop:1141 length:1020 start_codon:yes stop_codon:yes gene_type:complete